MFFQAMPSTHQQPSGLIQAAACRCSSSVFRVPFLLLSRSFQRKMACMVFFAEDGRAKESIPETQGPSLNFPVWCDQAPSPNGFWNWCQKTLFLNIL